MNGLDSLTDHWTKIIVLALVVGAIVAPLLAPSGYYLQVLLRLALFLGLVASWNLIGYTGYINFGQAAFYGTGAYLYGICTVVFEIGFVPSLLIGGIVAAVLAGILGGITMQLSGHYFSIASLLLLIIVTSIFTNLRYVGELIGDPMLRAELIPPPPEFFPEIGFTLKFYYLLIAAAIAVVILSIWLERSKYGYGMKAIDADEEVAEGLGIPTLRLKVLSIVLSGFAAGSIGAMHAAYVGYIDVSSFLGLTLTFLIVFVAMIGSSGQWYGPLVGVLLFIPADEFLASTVSPELGRIVFGGLFIVIMLLLPQGLGRYIADRLRGGEPIPETDNEGPTEAVAED